MGRIICLILASAFAVNVTNASPLFMQQKVEFKSWWNENKKHIEEQSSKEIKKDSIREQCKQDIEQTIRQLKQKPTDDYLIWKRRRLEEVCKPYLQ